MTLDRNLQTQVAWACRILAMGGHGDLTLGHVSARGADNAFYIKRSGLGLHEVTPDDVQVIDLDCRKIAGRGTVHLEAVMHTETYRARPDVAAVAHTHPLYATALGATEAELQMVNHDAVLFQEGLGRFGETAELITIPEQGAAVARALGRCRAVLLHNHGLLTVGKDVAWMVYTAMTLERAAQVQFLAAGLGALRPMSGEMARRLYLAKYPDSFVTVYWDYYVREVRRLGLADGMPDPAPA
jgi:L-fuculose-phosphate aldolase